MKHVKCLIVGSGPAGLTAAIYAARANMEPVVIEGMQPGGQLTITTEVDNFPGYPEGVTGLQLTDDIRSQAERLGTSIITGTCNSTDLSSRPFKVNLDDGESITSDTLIIATGASAKFLGLESEDKFRGMGVSACATCDGFFYKKKDVAVIGGGDTACEEATYLSGICNKVYLVVRKDHLKASAAMQDRVKSKPNITVLLEHVTDEILGDENGVNGIRLSGKDGKVDIIVDGVFIAIGHHPNSDAFKEWIETDENGYIKTRPGSSMTNIEGVFACGDVQDTTYRQAITAAASGCMAALDAERFLNQ